MPCLLPLLLLLLLLPSPSCQAYTQQNTRHHAFKHTWGFHVKTYTTYDHKLLHFLRAVPHMNTMLLITHLHAMQSKAAADTQYCFYKMARKAAATFCLKL